jgi:hypothetical protein
MGMYKLVSEHMESAIQVAFVGCYSFPGLMFIMQKNCEELFVRLEVKSAIDTLHSVVTDARARADSGTIGRDVWTESLEPWGAVRARAVPVLQKERDRLKAQLEKVRPLCVKC